MSSLAMDEDFDCSALATPTDSAAAHNAPAATRTEGRPKNDMVDLTLKETCSRCSTAGLRRKERKGDEGASADEQGIFLFLTAVPRVHVAEAAEGFEAGLERR